MISFLSNFVHMLHLVLGISTPQMFPAPLDSEAECRCFRLLATGDEEARKLLILHNLRLVSHIVRKYYSSAPNQEDLISIGTIGLVKAVDTYRPESNFKFATYAAKCIQNEVLMSFRSNKKYANEVSINETIDVDRDGNPLTYLDVIGTDDGMTEEVERKMEQQRAIKLVATLLDERQREIIILRFGLSGIPPMTQREVAGCLKISRSYVSRLEKSALATLESAMVGKGTTKPVGSGSE